MESGLTVNKKMDIANNYNTTKNLKNSLIKKVRGFLGWTLNLNRQCLNFKSQSYIWKAI
jgi:hypothetical protein